MTEANADDGRATRRVPIPKSLLPAIEDYRLEMQAKAPPGVVVTRADAINDVIKKGMARIRAQDGSIPP